MPFVIETDPLKHDRLLGRVKAKPQPRGVRWVGLLKHFEPKPPSAPVRRRLDSVRRYLLAAHAPADAETVEPILQLARNEGHIIWSTAGLSFSDDGAAMLRASRGLVLFCSENAFSSQDVIREVARAKRQHKPMLPVFIDNTFPPLDILRALASVEPVRITDSHWKPRFLRGLERLEVGARRDHATAL